MTKKHHDGQTQQLEQINQLHHAASRRFANSSPTSTSATTRRARDGEPRPPPPPPALARNVFPLGLTRAAPRAPRRRDTTTRARCVRCWSIRTGCARSSRALGSSRRLGAGARGRGRGDAKSYKDEFAALKRLGRLEEERSSGAISPTSSLDRAQKQLLEKVKMNAQTAELDGVAKDMKGSAGQKKQLQERQRARRAQRRALSPPPPPPLSLARARARRP